MKVVKTLQELEERLFNIDRGPGKDTAIIGGHYPINMHGEAETSLDGTFGVFPSYTFDLASRLVASSREKGRNVKIALVVDDHSLMNPPIWYRKSESAEERSQKVSAMVRNYFDNFSLPNNYLEIMAQNGLKESDFIRASPQMLPFQESAFRVIFEQDKKVDANCSGEYSYILRNLQAQGIGRVLSLIPQRCQGPTCQGAGNYNSEASRFGNPLIKTTHAYLPTDLEISTREELEEKISNGGIPYVTFG